MRNPLFWVTLARGIFAISLGLALFVDPDKTGPMLANFVGMYWLVSGILSIRWGASGERARGLPLVAGVVGVLAGIAVLTRNVSLGLISEIAVLYLLGTVILLTGVLHMVGGFRTGEDRSRQWSWGSFLLGLFEIVLGAMVIIEPFERGRIVNIAVGAWAFIAGALLIGGALRIRAQALRASGSDDAAL